MGSALRQLGQRLWAAGAQHEPFLILVLLTLGFRLPAFALWRAQGYIGDANDYNFYYEFARYSQYGWYPYLHFWMEYPPLFPWLAVGVFRVSLLLPTWQSDPFIWFRLLLGLTLLPFDLGNLALIYALARRLYDPHRAVQCGYLYALLFFPFYTLVSWFDTLPLFFLLAALWLLLRERPAASAAVAGLGFMIKVFPVLILPVLLRRCRPWREWARVLAAFALPVGLIGLPFLLLAPAYTLAAIQALLTRSPWETVWALAEGYYSFGWVPPLSERFDPQSATRPAYLSHLPWGLWALLGGLGYLGLWRGWSTVHRPRAVVLFTALTLHLALVLAKGYSPQFLVYLLPFLVLLFPTLRGVVYALLLTTVNLVEYPVYHFLFPDQPWLLAVVVIVRTAVLLILAAEYGLELFAERAAPRWTGRFRQATVTVTTLLVLVSSLGGLQAASAEWQERAYAGSPHRDLVTVIRTHSESRPAVLFTDEGLYREFYPLLHDTARLVLLPLDRTGALGTVQQVLREHTVVWTVGRDPQPLAPDLAALLQAWARPGGRVGSQALTAIRWYPLAAGATADGVPVIAPGGGGPSFLK